MAHRHLSFQCISHWTWTALLLFAVLLCSGSALKAQTLYGWVLNNSGLQIVGVNPSTGIATPVATLRSTENVGINGDYTALDPVGHRYFAYTYCPNQTTTFCVFSANTQSGAVSILPVSGPDANLLTNLQFDPATGLLYGSVYDAGGGDTIVSIDPSTAAFTAIARVGYGFFHVPAAATAYDLVGHRYFGIGGCQTILSDCGSPCPLLATACLFSVNVQTGAVATAVNLSSGAANPRFDSASGALYAETSTTNIQLVQIVPQTGNVALVATISSYFPIGAGQVAYDSADHIYFAYNGRNVLYSVNTKTGSVSSLSATIPGDIQFQPTSQPVCPVSVRLTFGIPAYPQYMVASFTPPNSSTILAYAASCGFASFNWQQEITVDPGANRSKPRNPSLINPANISPDGSLIAPPSYFDPPPGGWDYQDVTYNPYPFYFPAYPDPRFLNGCSTNLLPLYLQFCVVSSDAKTLSFVDAPGRASLAGISAATHPPAGSFLAFTTSLVGVGPGVDVQGNPTATTLFSWTWNSTFNGSACLGPLNALGLCNNGGVDQTAIDVYPPIPGSGTGGVSVTSISGVQLPSFVSPSQVTVTASGLAYSRLSQTFNGTVTLTNVSNDAVSGPLQILFTGVPANVTMVNATAPLSGNPYLTVPGITSFAPGQSISVSVQFKNPSNVIMNLSPVIYSGSIN